MVVSKARSDGDAITGLPLPPATETMRGLSQEDLCDTLSESRTLVLVSLSCKAAPQITCSIGQVVGLFKAVSAEEIRSEVPEVRGSVLRGESGRAQRS